MGAKRRISQGSGPSAYHVLVYDASKRKARLTHLDPIVLDTSQVAKPYLGGIALSHEGNVLFVADAHNQSLIEVEVETETTRRVIPLDGIPYSPVFSSDGKTLYVTLWDKKQVALVDVLSGDVRKTIDVGSHPNDLKLTPDGQRLFVANADNNNLAWIDITVPGSSEIRGFIPTGWYPSAVAISTGDGRVIVGNGKGGTSAPDGCLCDQPLSPVEADGEYLSHDIEYAANDRADFGAAADESV